MLTTLGRKGIVAVGIAVGVVVLIAGWLLLVSPVRSDISKTKAATVQQTEANDAAQLQLSTMRSIAKKLPQEQAELATLSQRVPDAAELPSLLRSIQAAATATGVSLDTLTPTKPTALASAPGISAVAISMQVTGGYAEVEQFDSALESLKRTFLVLDFAMTGAATQAGTGTQSLIQTTFSGQVLLRTSPATASTGS